MFIPFLSQMIAKGWISPAGGRFIESAVSVGIAAGVMYLADQYSNGGAADFRTAGTIAITAILQWYAKSMRDLDKAYAQEKDSLETKDNEG